MVQWATFPVFFGQVASAYEGIGTVRIFFFLTTFLTIQFVVITDTLITNMCM